MGRKRLVQPDEVLGAIRNHLASEGMPPTVEELRRALEVGSTRTVIRYLQELEISGDIARWSGARGIRLRRPADKGLQTVPVPLLGSVTAGALSLAEEHVEDWVRLPRVFATPPGATFFLLRVTGDSMNRARVDGGTIEDGDLALVRQQAVGRSGDIVVALVDGGNTIKRLRAAAGYCVLQPESSNPKHSPIVVQDDVQVQGLVIRVLKHGSRTLRGRPNTRPR